MDEKQEDMREESLDELERMLAADYDLEESTHEQAQLTEEPSPGRSTPRRRLQDQDITSLDGVNFSVSAWLEARKSIALDTLLQQQRILRADITKFKSSTQTLVHDNYSRFITAADIIKTMRAEFETMVVDTKTLNSTIDKATAASDTMNSALQEKRQQLADLIDTTKLIKQLQAVRQLPKSLQHLVNQHDYGSAVLLYSNMQPLLQEHGHIGFLRTISTEVQNTMKDTHEHLIGMLGDAEASEKSVSATAQMLRLLGVPGSNMEQSFLSGREIRAHEKMKSFRSRAFEAALHVRDLPAGCGEASQWQGLTAFMENLKGDIMPLVSQMLSVYMAVFSGRDEGEVGEHSPRVLNAAEGILRTFLSTIQWGIATHAVFAAAASAPHHLAVPQHLPADNQKASQPSTCLQKWSFSGDFGTAELAQAVHQLTELAQEQSQSLGMEFLAEQATAIAGGAWRYCLGCAVSAVEQSVVNILLNVVFDILKGADGGGTVQRCAGSCSAVLSHGCDVIAAAFLNASVQAAHADSDFPDLVQSELQQLLLSLKTRCYSLACGPPDTGPSVGWEAVLSTRSELGFKTSMRLAAASKHNPLFPPSPTGNSKSEAFSAPLSGHDSFITLNTAPEPYHCCSDVEMPGSVPSIMKLCTFLFFEVVESVALHGAHQLYGTQATRDTPPFVPKAVQDQLASSSKRILQQFVIQNTAEVVAAVREAFSAKEFLDMQPSDVKPARPWVALMINVIKSLVTEASTLLPSGDPLPRGLSNDVIHTRFSSRDSLATDALSESSLLTSHITPGLFREQGREHLPIITGTVFSVILAACTHILQCAVDTLQEQDTQPGCVHQCQVDLVTLKGCIDMQESVLYYQDIIAVCESKCIQGAVSLLSQAQLEAIMAQH